MIRSPDSRLEALEPDGPARGQVERREVRVGNRQVVLEIDARVARQGSSHFSGALRRRSSAARRSRRCARPREGRPTRAARAGRSPRRPPAPPTPKTATTSASTRSVERPERLPLVLRHRREGRRDRNEHARQLRLQGRDERAGAASPTPAENGKSRCTPATRPNGRPRHEGRGARRRGPPPCPPDRGRPRSASAAATTGSARTTSTTGDRRRGWRAATPGSNAAASALRASELPAGRKTAARREPREALLDARLDRAARGSANQTASPLGGPARTRGAARSLPAPRQQARGEQRAAAARMRRRSAPHGRLSPGGAAGRSKRTRKPPSGRFAAPIVPPCSSTIFFAIARPSPVPPLLAEK